VIITETPRAISPGRGPAGLHADGRL